MLVSRGTGIQVTDGCIGAFGQVQYAFYVAFGQAGRGLGQKELALSTYMHSDFWD